MITCRRILTVALSGALCCAPVLAHDCDNEMYRRYNPDKCADFQSSDGFSFTTTAMVASGAAALIGGTIALFSNASNGSDDTTPSATPDYVMPTLPTHIMVGADVDTVQLATATNTTEYIRNTSHYDAILAGYSLARGYTGDGSTIAVMDSGAHDFHGKNVAYFAGGPIAPDANVTSYQITHDPKHFKSFAEIGDIIKTATNDGANIYNFSWSATNISAHEIKSRTQFEDLTDKNFIGALSDAVVRNDAIFVWAAGNEYNNQSSAFSAAPLFIPEIQGHFVNVVAYDTATGELASFSNACGITKDYCIAAPGAGLESPKTSLLLDGTSFAAPIVSAAIAVIRDAFPYLESSKITALLFETARDIGAVGVDNLYGHGLLDLERATRPVGTALVPLSDTTTAALRTSTVTGTIGHSIKSADITLAFIDSYGRAYDTKLNNNIRIKNRGLGFERLRTDANTSIKFNNLELGFKKTEMFASDGFLQTDDNNTITYIGFGDTYDIAGIQFSHRTTLGTTTPHASPDTIINGFSNIYTASVSVGAKYGKFAFSVGTPDTIIHGNMYLRTPTGRRTDGKYTFANHTINLSSRPSVEYTASYGNVTAGFIDNPYGTDEVYVLAKTKLQF